MKTITCLFAVLFAAPTFCSAEDTRLYEMRTYHANPGKLKALHARFRDHTVKLFQKHGITNVGYWIPKKNTENVLIYVLAYPDRETRDVAWKGFMGDDQWKQAYAKSTEDGKLVKKIDSVFMKATDYSPEIKPQMQDEARTFELRIYTTNKGKLKTLHSRFRDHTTTLFAKHGLHQFAYWTPVKEKDGRDNKLIYMLAHKDENSRKQGFKAFGADPKWKSAREASVKDGPILIRKGVKATLMDPTDYSPTK